MSGELIFVTGAAGFVGAQTVSESLKAGYRVRGSVRRSSQVDQLNAFFGPQYGSKAEFVTVPDMLKPNAYDGLLEGVDYIFHIASPLLHEGTDWEKDYIEPAVGGTTNLLEAALKVKSVKRVVITSSIITIRPLGGVPDGVPDRESNATLITIPSTNSLTNTFQAYSVSKLLADAATTDFKTTHSPHFQILTLHPSFIYGRNLLQTSFAQLTGTNAMLYAALTHQNPTHPTRGIHVLDVAEAHIRALSIDVEKDPDMKNESWSKGIGKFLLSVGPWDWSEIGKYVKAKYPQVSVPVQGAGMEHFEMDLTRAKKYLGMEKLRGIEEMVDDVFSQLVSFEDFPEKKE